MKSADRKLLIRLGGGLVVAAIVGILGALVAAGIFIVHKMLTWPG